MGPRPVSSSSSGSARRFEQAITWARIGGAIAAGVVAPLIPNLGPVAIGALVVYLFVWGIVLHFVSARAVTLDDEHRVSWIAFFGDSVVILLAMLVIAPDPVWALFPLFGVIFIITSSFRLGDAGAIIAALIVSAELLGVAVWRDRELGLGFPLPYIAFDIVMYTLSAYVTASMLHEVGTLRRERRDLMSRVSDVDQLRRSEATQSRLLERERGARTEAELVSTRLEALQRVSDSALRHVAIDELLPELLEQVAQTFGASAAALLTVVPTGLRVLAGHGLTEIPRVELWRGGDLASALGHREPVVIGDASTAALDAVAGTYVATRVVVSLRDGQRVLGLLYLAFERPRELVGDDATLLSLVAERVASALARAELFESERRARAEAEVSAARVRLLLGAADAMLDAADLPHTLERLARLAIPQLADSCAIELLREDGELELVAVAANDPQRERDMWMAAHRYPHHQGTHPLFEMLRTRAPAVLAEITPQDLDRLSRGPHHTRVLLERGVHSWLGVPIVLEGKVRGTIECYRAETHPGFGPNDLVTAQALADRIAVALARDTTAA